MISVELEYVLPFRLFVPCPRNPCSLLVRDNLKVGKVTKGSSGTVARKKLADISNLKQQPRNLTQDEKCRYGSSTAKEYIEQLQKENMALMQMLADRNKMVEVTRNELQKLRVNLQKMQQQNLQLAQSNSQLLAELSSGKDRLKALQHELGCRNGLLKVKILEEEEKLKLKACQKVNNEVKSINSNDPGEPTMGGRDDSEQNNTRRRLRSKRLAPAMQVESKDKAGNKRACLRRQSARFKPEELESSEGESETATVKFSLCSPTPDSVPEKCSTSLNGMRKDEDSEGNASPRCKPQEFVRSSLARPSRQAAKKVQSYKEIPLNVKMRRPG